MSGIISGKERIFDTIVTQEGKAQIASGKLVAEFVSFSDMGAIYKLDTIISGGLDATYRLCFEASNLPQDLITLEADDSGKLTGLFINNNNYYNVSAGQIFSGSLSRNEERTTISGTQFASLSGLLLSRSLDNFKNLYTLSSPDLLDKTHDEFIVSPIKKTFFITENGPVTPEQIQETNVDAVESLFFDKRLSNIPNFDFMPPINKLKPGDVAYKPLGLYASLGQRPYLDYSDIMNEINAASNNGYQERIYFTETSKENNLLCQFFEIAGNQMTKLDVIDFGSFTADAFGVARHIYFVGKIFVDGNGTDTFVNMFTIVFES